MQNENTRSTSQRKQFKNIILIACALVMGILLVWAYASMLAEFFSVGDNNDGSNNNISSNDNMNMKKEAVREIYKAYLEDKYSGTYYEGEFVVDGEIATGGTLYPNGFGTYAYRADIPELKFFMRSSISGAAIEDYFWQTHITWEGAQEMGDVITGIYGEEVLYKVNAVCTEATAFEREGYSNLVSHYAEDGSYPHIEVVVFTDEFD